MGFKDLYYLKENVDVLNQSRKNGIVDTIINSGKLPDDLPTYIKFVAEPYRSIIQGIIEVVPNNNWQYRMNFQEKRNAYFAEYSKDRNAKSGKIYIQYIPLYKYVLADGTYALKKLKAELHLYEDELANIMKKVKQASTKSLILMRYTIYESDIQDKANIINDKMQFISFSNAKQLDTVKLTEYVTDFQNMLLAELDMSPNIESKETE